jgi:hypothetical protein
MLHSLSYNSLDCTTKLLRHIFSDSETEYKLSCGGNKAEALVTNILVLKSVEDFVKILNVCRSVPVRSQTLY